MNKILEIYNFEFQIIFEIYKNQQNYVITNHRGLVEINV